MNVPDLDPINLTVAAPGEIAPPVPAVPDAPPSGPDGQIEWPHDPPTTQEYGGADPLVVGPILPADSALEPPSGNVLNDRPHFLRVLPDGTEVCGQDGQPWECDGYRQIREDFADTTGVPADTVATAQGMVPLETVAVLMGTSMGELTDRMAAIRAQHPKE